MNTGDKYWTVVAMAKGKCCNVMKNKKRPVEPKSPLEISQTLLLPKKGIFLRVTTTIQIESEIMERKKTNSCTGYECGFGIRKLGSFKSLTPKLTSENVNVAANK